MIDWYDPRVAVWVENLAELIQPQSVEKWLSTRNESFQNRRPIDMILADDVGQLEDMLWQIRDNVAS